MKTSQLETYRKRFCSNMANKHATQVSKSELERDSCFSDASSGYFSALDQTEFEDMGSSISAEQNLQSSLSQIPLVPGSYQGVSPMIIMNNVVLKQPDSAMPALKPWGFNPSLEVVPQSPVVLLQPMAPGGNSTSQPSTNHQRQSKNYVPILNSFLKIAPHPAHGATGESGPSPTHKSSSSHRHGGRHRRHRHNDKQTHGHSLKQISENTNYGGNSVDLPIFNTVIEDVGFDDSSSMLLDFQKPSVTTAPFCLSTGTPSPIPEKPLKAMFAYRDDTENFPVALSPCSSKRERFCNTYNILNRSGLLGITLRTKELIRQNKRSQAQLKKLQAHTDLFLEALNSRDPQVWAELQLTLQNPVSEESKDMLGNSGLDATAIGCM